MIKELTPLDLKKVYEVKEQEALIQEAEILEFFTENFEEYGDNFDIQDALTSRYSTDSKKPFDDIYDLQHEIYTYLELSGES